MASRSEAHKTLSLMFARDGVPPACLCNHAKEMIQGKYYQKLKDAACHLKQLEPYIAWSNTTEREIKELKKRASYKLLWSKASRCFWGDCIELKAYMRSNNAHDINKLDKEVPEIVISGETSHISNFWESVWFEWVMFWDETAPFSDDVLKLSHYIGPSIDIGQAMTVKIFTENGQGLHRLTYRPLMPNKISDKNGLDDWEQFMARVYESWGPLFYQERRT